MPVYSYIANYGSSNMRSISAETDEDAIETAKGIELLTADKSLGPLVSVFKLVKTKLVYKAPD